MKHQIIQIGLLCLIAASVAASVSNEEKCVMAHQNLQREAQKLISSVENFEVSSVFTHLISLEVIIPLFEEVCPSENLAMPQTQTLECLDSVQQVYQICQMIVDGTYQISQQVSSSLLNMIPQAIANCDSSKLSSFSTVKDLLEKSSGESGENPMKCIACDIIVTLATNDAALKRVNISDYVSNHFCKIFPNKLASTCDSLITLLGPFIIEGFTKKENSDVICRKANMCVGQNAQCNLHSKSTIPSLSSSSNNIFKSVKKAVQKVSPWDWVMNLVNKFADGHLPVVDFDSDGFSTISHLRGYSWRGKDCDDFSKEIYPGRKSASQNQKSVDFDCNGISGVNTVSGATYKEELCEGSDRLGVIVIGDSAGAHFSIPPKYFNVSMWEKGTFEDLIPNASNEFDFPELSASTGHIANPLVHSIYERVVELNRCNRNDYQNIGVNGARSSALDDFKAIRRNQTLDHPQLVIFELIGNDVCHGNPSVESMTSPSSFRQNVLNAWNYLDTVLPKGSHMVVWGLAHGTLLYDLLHNREHPLSIKYSDFYDYLNCLEESPCAGWMNSDESIRNATQARADELNEVYHELIASTTFKNFDIIYYDFPIQEAIDLAEKDGYEAYQLIEPVDGFHPNQVANYYISQIIWERLTTDRPEWIPKENPRNHIIDTLFSAPNIVLESA